MEVPEGGGHVQAEVIPPQAVLLTGAHVYGVTLSTFASCVNFYFLSENKRGVQILSSLLDLVLSFSDIVFVTFSDIIFVL